MFSKIAIASIAFVAVVAATAVLVKPQACERVLISGAVAVGDKCRE